MRMKCAQVRGHRGEQGHRGYGCARKGRENEAVSVGGLQAALSPLAGWPWIHRENVLSCSVSLQPHSAEQVQ